MPPRQHSGGPAPDIWNGDKNPWIWIQQANRLWFPPASSLPFQLFQGFFWNIQRFPTATAVTPPVGHPIRPKVRTAMDSIDSEEAEFLEPEQDEAEFAHDDAVCIYIYNIVWTRSIM